MQRAAATPSMMAKIRAHQSHVAEAFGVPRADAQWGLATVAFHCIAVADTVYSTVTIESAGSEMNEADYAALEEEFELGMQALIDGVLLRVSNPLPVG